MTSEALANLVVDHVRFHVGDVHAAARHLTECYGFAVYATSRNHGGAEYSVGLGAGRIRLVLTEARAGGHPAATAVERHGDTVADIALRTPDTGAAFAEAVRRGARPVAGPVRREGIVTAVVEGVGDVVHTFVQRPPGTDCRAVPGLVPCPDVARVPLAACGLNAIDHVAVCLEAGRLEQTVAFYRDVLGFREIFTEVVAVGAQAMDSRAVQSVSGDVTLTLVQPHPAHGADQIADFVDRHGGPGVQHLAFGTDDIVRSVRALRSRGVRFLPTPEAYYRELAEYLTPARHRLADLRELGLLADEDHDGQLFQVFARSVHPRRTFFLEVIERMGARSFGSRNIRALYGAVERERPR